MIPFVDLKTQYKSIQHELDEAIRNVINDCAFIQGKYCKEFEENFARACESSFCVGCSNGTTALELALFAYGIGQGDEVILPSHTFIATAEAVSNVGATPIFAEIENTTFTINPNDIEKRITSKTKAILPVHVYGQVADMDSILEIAKKHNLAVIEDCAQAHLAEYKGHRVPVGETGCFSFFPGKNLGAYGDAGAVVTKNEKIAEKIREKLNHGRKKGEKYSHSSIGTNYRMDGLQGAILNTKLKHLPKWTERRRQAAALYNKGIKNNERLKGHADIIPPIEADYGKHVYHLYVIRTPRRDELMQKLKENEIECGVHYPIPLHLQKAYAFLGHKEGDFPVTEQAAKEILSLPICGNITDESIQKVLSIFSIH
ncbi:DegT/DnrJ/EryC1/StrS family aminotransferase [Candidatus Peregrinibacteria bacterium]|nr:DegT/DnrJ/EryC1/StrS family aminotransferase [Candidatus Peregrinibacteria bacterium]